MSVLEENNNQLAHKEVVQEHFVLFIDSKDINCHMNLEITIKSLLEMIEMLTLMMVNMLT